MLKYKRMQIYEKNRWEIFIFDLGKSLLYDFFVKHTLDWIESRY